MRLRIQHSSVYRYDPPATGVIQVIRKMPRSFDGQYVAEWRTSVSTDSRLQMRQDAFGNITHVLTLGTTEELTITVEGLVETHDTHGVVKGTDERFPPSFFLRTTEHTATNAGMQDFAAHLRSEADTDVIGFLHALMAQIGEHMTYDAGPSETDALTTAIDAFGNGRGRSQDYAHVFIACARSGGVPARFISGHVLQPDGTQQDAGHGWAEAFVPGLGWVGFDPANGLSPTDSHVRVAVGLDYLGAAPVRATRYGGGDETLSVAVKVQQAGRQSQA
jgi:transglutaminase-like putative cysteine protease